MTLVPALVLEKQHVLALRDVDLPQDVGPTGVRIAIDTVSQMTDGWGVDVVFECSGSSQDCANIMDLPRTGGTIVAVGFPVGPVPVDIVAATTREVRIETVFRYAHQYDPAIALMASGKVDLKPLISETFPFSEAIAPLDRAVEARATDVKIQISLR